MTFSFLTSYAQRNIKVFGKVTDFDSRPLDSVTVKLMNDKFEDLYTTVTDKEGNYELKVKKGTYFCLYAIKLTDYNKSKLQYWAWNVPAIKDLEINPQYERMELYGLNVVEPKVSPYKTYMVYFRPMSLSKALKLTNLENKKNFEQKATSNHDTIDIAPNTITAQELSVKINGVESEVVNIQKTVEYARGAFIYGYWIQVLKPQTETSTTDPGLFDKISIMLHSKETCEIGKSEIFVEKVCVN